MNNVRNVRLSKGIAQQELAVKAGTNPSFLTMIEKYGYRPGGSLRQRIAIALGVTDQELWPEEKTDVR